MARLAELVLVDREETIARLEMNAAKCEIEACACGKTPHACELAAKRAARCRRLAEHLRIEATMLDRAPTGEG
jgi:hypothetical protein